MKDLTAKEIAEIQNVEKRVVINWLNNGLFPNARKETIEPFGEIWLVPESDVVNFTKPVRGRKPKQPSSGRKAA